MIRDPAICLGDMLDYACDIQPFVNGMDAQAFANDRKTQYAVLRALDVIGKAANVRYASGSGVEPRWSVR